ncbi:uncharacterized protein LOC111043674 isoform X1 [Nilaparvata lugens]|uniref:uncharacterized protein LOC111043674 isoform X1 n=1 Tax=Nilaparvata lugens TaxID=108931 RepID=UPI00193DBE52|nr:uncharacterized protein LOC111043674 isoform X1 [Nilaparvata lugens]
MQAPCYRDSMNEQVITNELISPDILPDNSHLDLKDAVQWTRSQQQAPPQGVAMDTGVVAEAAQSPVQAERYFSSRKQQKYRKAWEDLPEFALWLEGVDNNFYKARCKMCAKTILADLSVLRLHAQGRRHNQLCDDFNKAKAALQSMAVAPGSTAPTTKAPVIMSSIRKIVLPSGATTSAAPRRLDAGDSSTDLTQLTELGPEANPTFSLEPTGAFGVEGGVQVQASAAAPRLPKPPQEATVYVSKAFVTKPAPPWKATAIVNGHVTRLELNDYKGRYVILFFYPQDFAAVCPTEILALSDRVSEFRALQTEIVACSVDSHLTHLTWCRMARSDGGLANPKIPLLADPTHSISRDYGVLMPDVGHSLRAHFIIDRRGTIRHMCVNDMSVGRSVDELLRMVQALQHVDEHEAGCPADWKPGQPSV